MNILRGSLAVFLFECRRSWTPSRIACWLVLVLFPPTIFGLLRMAGMATEIRDHMNPQEIQFVWTNMAYYVPLIMCLLALLLWATPTVYTELEGKTWIYLAVRPNGRDVVLVGKYLTAVAWSAAAAWLGMTFTLAIITNELLEPIKTWIGLSGIIFCGSIAYGSLYCFIGVMFRKKAMAVAITFTIIVEIIIARLPALVNQITVQHRLLSLLDAWLDVDTVYEVPGSPGEQPAWVHLTVLAMYSLSLLVASSLILRMREHITAEET